MPGQSAMSDPLPSTKLVLNTDVSIHDQGRGCIVDISSDIEEIESDDKEELVPTVDELVEQADFYQEEIELEASNSQRLQLNNQEEATGEGAKEDNDTAPTIVTPTVTTTTVPPDDSSEKKGYNNMLAVVPTNVLLDYESLKHAMKQFDCPKCIQHSIRKCSNKKTLEISQSTHGFASIVTISCTRCKEEVATVKPQHKHTEFEGKGSKGSFMLYAIKYNAVLIMQQLGMGLTGLAMIFGFLGIAAGVGGMDKWKNIQDAVGAAQQEVCEEVLCANVEKEIAATKINAQKKAEEWTKTEGKQQDEEAKEAKMEEFLAYVNGQDGQVRMGFTVTMDGAWQKRSSGNNNSSRTGHNFAIGRFCGLSWKNTAHIYTTN
jgi:hypothetical protein